MEPNIEILKACLARVATEVKYDCKYMRMKTCLWDTIRETLDKWKNRSIYYGNAYHIAMTINELLTNLSDMLSGEIDDFNYEPKDGEDLADIQRYLIHRIKQNFHRDFLIQYNLYWWVQED